MAHESSPIIFSYPIPKNNTEQYRLTLKSFRGNYFIDFRLWFRSDENALIPTKKGIFIPLESLRELKEGVDKIVLASLELTQNASGPKKCEPAENRSFPRRDKALQKETQQIK